MEPCTTYQNTHHQLTVVIGSQRGKTCWPFMFKLMSNINKEISVIKLARKILILASGKFYSLSFVAEIDPYFLFVIIVIKSV